MTATIPGHGGHGVEKVSSAWQGVVVVLAEPQRVEASTSTNAGHWWMKVDKVVINYEWDGACWYWRVHSSVISGAKKSKVAPEAWTFPRGAHLKPLWLAALEHKYYPREGFKNV